MLHDIWMAATQADAEKAFDLFIETWQAKYPKATESLAKDRDALLAFYDFPAEHWVHMRAVSWRRCWGPMSPPACPPTVP